MPLSLLEAMSYGMPIISTNVGGIPEVVKTGINGILIEPGNLNAIKNSIDYYIKNRSQILVHGEGSLILVKPFLPEVVFESLTEIYQKLS